MKMVSSLWQESLRSFFEGRAASLRGTPSFEELCYVSGRDPRLWVDKDLYEDLVQSIVHQLGVGECSRVLELGCAAGFLAKGIAPRVGRYVGVDLAEPLINAVRRLELPNAELHVVDGEGLPFREDSFDAAFCYDVVTNFPHFADIAPLIDEMLRIAKPGGKVMVGSVPDQEQRESYERRASEVSANLARFGQSPVTPPARRLGVLARLIDRMRSRPATQGAIVCYYFSRQSFLDFAAQRDLPVWIEEIHPLSPYRGMRFNVLFSKPMT